MTPVITDVVAHARRDDRYDLLVDGKRTAVLSAEGIQRLDLHTGDEWTPALAALADGEAASLRVLDRALAMLAARARSARELRLGLLRKREPEALVDAAVARLVRSGAVDDASFARQFVRSRATRAGHSGRRLRAELARRGVSREIADASIAEVIVEEAIDPVDTLDRLVARKLRTLAKLDAPTRKRRLYAFLARRGYDAGEIREALSRQAH